MPASLRTHVSRASSSRPYDRRSPTASPAQSENPLVHPHSFSRVSPASPIHHPYPSNADPSTDLHADTDPDADIDADTDAPPDHPGLPTYAEYKRIQADYLHGLSPRKRDKALITQAMFDKIWDVLHQPDACTIETPQFRFWVRKMFTLARPAMTATPGLMGAGVGDEGGRGGGWGGGGIGHTGNAAGTSADSDSDGEEAGLALERAMGIGRTTPTSDLFPSAVVLHESRPVAIMEQLYELFCYCHVRAGHGGRDKTCAVIRQHYSWVPKELTAQFVKACPTCALKRSGHGGVGVGVDMGLVQRRAVGQRERRGRGMAEEMPVSVVPSSLGSAGWPTTGGPLDPANPEPCGVREREREQEKLRAREDARTVGPSSPMSPARGSRTRSVPRQVPLESWPSSGWSSVAPRALTLDASPFLPCDMTHSVGTAVLPQPFAVELDNGSRTRSDRDEKGSPTRTIGLPSLASALSNESLDENVNLTELGPELCAASGGGDVGGCLPPALRPLRLSGPIPSTDAESDQPPPASSSSSYLFQIDPVLLSFNYPGLSMDLSESGFASCPEADVMPLVLPMSTGTATLPSDSEQGHSRLPNSTCVMPNVITGLYDRLDRLRAPSESDVDVEGMPALETSDRSTVHSADSPDSSFDNAATSTYGASMAMLPLSLSTELGQTSRCGLRYGYRDHGSLAMLLPCLMDEAGQELDGALSFSIMTDV